MNITEAASEKNHVTNMEIYMASGEKDGALKSTHKKRRRFLLYLSLYQEYNYYVGILLNYL